MPEYRYTYTRHQGPGCGTWLLLFLGIVLLAGGFPALFNVLGFLVTVALGLMGLLVLGIFGFSFYIRHRIAKYEASQTELHNRFVYLLVRILVKIAQADGHFTRGELKIMTDFFQQGLHYNQDQMYWVKQLIKEARDAPEDLDTLLAEFRDSFAYEARLILLDLVYQVVYAKEPVPEAELNLADHIAQVIQVLAQDHASIRARFAYGHAHPQSGEAAEARHAAILGVEPDADFETIKKAYRKLSLQYHPDKAAQLGEEFRSVAEEKMKEINAAYDFFKKKFRNG